MCLSFVLLVFLRIALFIRFVNKGSHPGYVGFSTPISGHIIPIDLQEYGGELLCRDSAFICHLRELKIESVPQEKQWIWERDSLRLQRLQGSGLVFISARGTGNRPKRGSGEIECPFGLGERRGIQMRADEVAQARLWDVCFFFIGFVTAVLQKHLKEDERVIVNAGCVVAFSKEVKFEIKYASPLYCFVSFDKHFGFNALVICESEPESDLGSGISDLGRATTSTAKALLTHV